MPKLSGFAATAAIRSRTDDRHAVPIIAMTGNTSAYDRRLCQAAGMDGYLTKPVSPEDLAAVLGQHAGRRLRPPPSEPAPSAGPVDGDPLDSLSAVLGRPKVDALVAEYVRAARDCLGRIAAALGAGDAGQVRATAHDLKSMSGSLGFVAIAELARSIEVAARGGDLAQVRRLMPQLTHEIEGLFAESGHGAPTA
jgi:HPt (histidine-containing phosphotransfer) domain-containing protein